VRRYRRGDPSIDPVIGCNVLARPFYLPPSAWIPVPVNWAPNIVQGKTYDANMAEGRALWNSVQAALADNRKVGGLALSDGLYGQNRFGAEYLTRGRLGQGAFRVLVTEAYDRRCAVTGEKS
jgi:putative restriction endonuclease